jgi:hypothetical protein
LEIIPLARHHVPLGRLLLLLYWHTAPVQSIGERERRARLCVYVGPCCNQLESPRSLSRLYVRLYIRTVRTYNISIFFPLSIYLFCHLSLYTVCNPTAPAAGSIHLTNPQCVQTVCIHADVYPSCHARSPPPPLYTVKPYFCSRALLFYLNILEYTGRREVQVSIKRRLLYIFTITRDQSDTKETTKRKSHQLFIVCALLLGCGYIYMGDGQHWDGESERIIIAGVNQRATLLDI